MSGAVCERGDAAGPDYRVVGPNTRRDRIPTVTQPSPSSDRTVVRPRVRLTTLGPTLLEREGDDGTWQPLLRTGKVLGLLVHLACRDGRRLTRAKLADVLWGDEAPERSRATLRTTLHSLRALIGEDVVDADRDEIGLVPGSLTVDRNEFLVAARADDFDAMLTAYGGPFCQRLEVGAADAFERWASAERDRLRDSMLDGAARAIPARIASGQTQAALDAARRLDAVEPGNARVAVLLFDALVSAGAIAEARERIEDVRVQLNLDRDSMPPAIAERLARVKRAALSLPMPAAGTLAALGQELVGREAQMDILLREAELARAGRPRRIVLVGPAGVGKSRILDEFDARMRLRGARVVRVRLLPGMRDVPYSAFADSVRALAALPAAIGVSESTAQTLVGLLPELSSSFPAARGAVLPVEDRAFALRDAAADLFASVSEQRLVVHLVDDLHYADDASRELFRAVRLETERRHDQTMRLLTVRSMRRISPADVQETDEVIEVGPLLSGGVRRLLEDVATLPEYPWADRLVARLEARSGGVPQLALQAIRVAASQGLLRANSGIWESPDPETLVRSLDEFAGLGGLLATLSPAALRVLRLLAAWGRPLDERDLAGVCASDVPPLADADWRPALRALEELGLVQSRELTWGIAHDIVLEAVAKEQREAAIDDPFDALLGHFGDHARLTVGVLEHLSLLAGHSDGVRRAKRLVTRASGAPALRRAGLVGRALSRAVASGSGHQEWEGSLYRALGFITRQGERARAVLVAGATLAAAVSIWLVTMLQPRLVVDVEPLAENSAPSVIFGDLIVQPSVLLVNGFGRQLALSGDVHVRSSSGQLFGDTIVSLDSGRAQFRRLTFLGEPLPHEIRSVDLRFRGPWYVRSTEARLLGYFGGKVTDDFVPRELFINGERVDESRIVRSRLGDSLRFDLTFEFSTIGPTANYILAASPTWGARDRNVVRISGLPSPVLGGWRTVTFVVPPPPTKGSHHVLILFGAEDSAEHMFSSTNWTVGAPRWFDGNDVLDAGFARFEELRRTGTLVVERQSMAPIRTGYGEVRLGDRLFAQIPQTEYGEVTRRWKGVGVLVVVE